MSTERELAERLAHVLPGITVARVNVRDAGTPPPGEAPPLVLLDMRKGGVGLDAVSALRRARPRASILALIDGDAPAAAAYQAGALAVLPAELELVAACFRSVAQNR
ncbi:MAG: hypothetical protein E6J82_11705, partial [Deltaproteobacteria bacterium]